MHAVADGTSYLANSFHVHVNSFEAHIQASNIGVVARDSTKCFVIGTMDMNVWRLITSRRGRRHCCVRIGCHGRWSSFDATILDTETTSSSFFTSFSSSLSPPMRMMAGRKNVARNTAATTCKILAVRTVRPLIDDVVMTSQFWLLPTFCTRCTRTQSNSNRHRPEMKIRA